ncbi:MAG TPA: heme ABC transporter ATP-binding protein [Marinobacter sp.]|nr:heme ABC transporter ATP-binding protein [Marinobacter sp.]
MSLLLVDQVCLNLGQKSLLDHISFTLERGEILAIIGPNGAGKTSLLRAITQELVLASGSIRFCGHSLHSLEAQARARQLAVLTQHNPLTFAFTAAEVVALSRTPHSTGAKIDADICQQAMQLLDVAHLAERVYPSLSGGEQQRVQLARVMAQIWRGEDAGERLLLLDEPVTSLDIGHQHQLMQAVRAFADSGVAVLMVVHDITLAAAYSDRLLALDEGKTVALGMPEQVVTEALISQLFHTQVTVLPHPVSGKPVVLGG